MGNYDVSRRHRMQWQGSLADMKACGTLVRRMCSDKCQFWVDVDVDEMLALLGPDGDLWDQRPACPRCPKRNHFLCSPGAGTPFRPMLSQNRGPEPERPPGGWPAWPGLPTPRRS